MCFVNVSSPPNAMDLDSGRRVGNMEDFKNFMRLTQYFNCIHVAGGYPVEPVDIHASVRHLDCLFEKLTLTDKVVHAYSLGAERVEDVIEMARIASGLPQAEFESQPRLFTNINSSSPLKHDFPMLDGAMRFARRGQPVIVTPFTLAGAMAPVTMAGAVVLSIAEALAAIALLQVIRPGVPCMIGTFTSNVDMKSGAPAFGTPEYLRATQMTGQMARFYGLPLRASNACASNAPDGQAMWESLNSLWSAVQSGVNLVYHAAGWLDGRLIASYEKFVMDCEVLQQFQRYFEPTLTDTSPDALAVDAIAAVGPHSHFFGPSTRKAVIPRPSTPLSSATGATTRPGRKPAAHHRAARQPHLEGDPRRVRAAAHGRGHPRRARCLRRPPQARRRRADRLLTNRPNAIATAAGRDRDMREHFSRRRRRHPRRARASAQTATPAVSPAPAPPPTGPRAGPARPRSTAGSRRSTAPQEGADGEPLVNLDT